MKKFLIIPAVIVLLYSCTNKNEDYIFKYSLESISNYKVTLTFNRKDSTCAIQEFNYFFDNMEKRRRPLTFTGKLSKPDYDRFTDLISGSKLLKLKDNYGFENATDATGAIIYQISYITGHQEKYITIKPSANDNNFSSTFLQLINFCNQKIRLIKSK
jgi:hypothetical protein